MRNTKDSSKWFLVDWEDAATPPTQARSSLTGKYTHLMFFRMVMVVMVDIWSIGHLIKTYPYYFPGPVPDPRCNKVGNGKLLCHDGINGVQACGKVKGCSLAHCPYSPWLTNIHRLRKSPKALASACRSPSDLDTEHSSEPAKFASTHCLHTWGRYLICPRLSG